MSFFTLNYRISKKTFTKLYILSFVSALAALCILSGTHSYHVEITFYSKQFAISILIVSAMLFYKLEVGSFTGEGFTELLWKTFLTLVAAVVFFILSYITSTVKIVNIYTSWISFAFQIILLTNVFYVFKKLILYQKSKEIKNIWNLFEKLIFVSILFVPLGLVYTQPLYQLSLLPMLALTAILAFHLKWIAYLNYKQKIWCLVFMASLLLYLVILILQIVYQGKYGVLITKDTSPFTFIVLFIFILFYTTLSIFVLLFNLPTTSVFEQKFEEIINIQKLSNSLNNHTSEESIYSVLLESVTSTLFSKHAVLEIYENTDSLSVRTIYIGISKNDFYFIKTILRKNNVHDIIETTLFQNLEKLKYAQNIPHTDLRCLLSIPLNYMGNPLGTMYIFTDPSLSFDKQMINIAETYIQQASTAISNFRLVKLAEKNAIYKKELDIAQEMQHKLIPIKFDTIRFIEVAAHTQSIDQVGGDYFDYAKIKEGTYAFIIGDVSGKGTSAAFQMAELKGIFQSLVLTNSNTTRIMELANLAVSRCIDKNSFITASIVKIELEKFTVDMVRCGHCPTIYYDSTNGLASYIDQKGLGLGIVRNETFSQHIESKSIRFKQGDVFVLYTDGVIEARNSDGKIWGNEELLNVVQTHANKTATDLLIQIKKKIYAYAGTEKLDDDVSLLIIKIKES